MTYSKPHQIDPRLDLVLERVIDVPRELVWKAWTTPEHLKPWFTPAPWTTAECEIDLRPGGIFSTVMRSPEGKDFPNLGCYLEIIPNEKLVWTNALEPGFRPAKVKEGSGCEGLIMTAILTLQPHGKGTKYTAIALHNDEASAKMHADLGFQSGWGTVLDQLVAHIKKM